MSRDKLDRKELLEQYLLGLTSREQTDYVEQQLKEDPTMVEDLAELRGKMTDYLTEQGFDGETPTEKRDLQDFHDLDHEMITAMTRRNHNLVIWRLALSGVCLVLLFATGYLFRENQNFRMEVAREKALHAQDEASHRRKLETLQGKAIIWDSLHTQTITSGSGDVLVHYLADDEVTFLDLSHLDSLVGEDAYYVQVSDEQGQIELGLVEDTSRNSLIPVIANVEKVKIWRGKRQTLAAVDSTLLAPVADFPLLRDGQKVAQR